MDHDLTPHMVDQPQEAESSLSQPDTPQNQTFPKGMIRIPQSIELRSKRSPSHSFNFSTIINWATTRSTLQFTQIRSMSGCGIITSAKCSVPLDIPIYRIPTCGWNLTLGFSVSRPSPLYFSSRSEDTAEMNTMTLLMRMQKRGLGLPYVCYLHYLRS